MRPTSSDLGRRSAPRLARVAGFAARHPRGFATIRRVQREGLTFLDLDALCDIYSAVRTIERHRVRGAIVEAGCAAGGSGIVIAAAKSRHRSFLAYDVFGMIPPPSDRDGSDVHARYAEIASGNATGPQGTTYYGYEQDLLETVRNNFDRFGLPPDEHEITFVKGLYEETLHGEGPIALAHIDCDWYDSVITCLQRITPRLQQEGLMIIDDYFAWSGCREAVDDYFRQRKDEFTFTCKARLQITRR